MTAADGRYIGPVIRVHGTNFVIEGCDLYGTTDVIETQNNFNGSHPSYTGDVGTAWTQVHGAWWGRIANNKLYNGAGCSHRSVPRSPPFYHSPFPSVGMTHLRSPQYVVCVGGHVTSSD